MGKLGKPQKSRKHKKLKKTFEADHDRYSVACCLYNSSDFVTQKNNNKQTKLYLKKAPSHKLELVKRQTQLFGIYKCCSTVRC